LREAIEGSRLQLYFQPIVSLANRSATMLESLPRWPHPDEGILAPADFIEIAEENDLLAPLERWAIEDAFRHLARWDSGVAGELTISLNLSEEHVYAGDVAEVVRIAAQHNGVDAERIGFELPEAALIEAGSRSIEKLRALAGCGATLAVDDYCGELPLELLRELPVRALKIARRIVEAIPDDADCVDSARATVDLTRELDLLAIANGVETPGQLAALRDLGCGYAQGFLFSVPMPAEVLEERMTPR
jgi:EAL domain-containing protein (putative c-di-GMP-specific phosphodiesterase class I)